MNREEFARRLYSVVIPEGEAPEGIQTMTRPVSEAIREIMPKSLFRFRVCNELSGSRLRCRIYRRRLRMRYGSLTFGRMRRSGE